MGEPRRFAEGTKVSVDKTQGEIKALLGKHGATGFLLAGGTVGDVLVPQLAESYENGSMPRLLPGSSS